MPVACTLNQNRHTVVIIIAFLLQQDDTSSPTSSPSIRNDPSFLRQSASLSRFGPSAGQAFSSVQDPSTSFNSRSLSQITTATLTKGNLDNSQPGSARLSSYAERLSATSTFNDGLGGASPKMKKIGAETREELLNISRQEVGRTASAVSGASTQIATNVRIASFFFILEIKHHGIQASSMSHSVAAGSIKTFLFDLFFSLIFAMLLFNVLNPKR